MIGGLLEEGMTKCCYVLWDFGIFKVDVSVERILTWSG